MNRVGTSTAAADRNAWADPRLVILACGMFAIGTDSFVIAGILPRISQDLNVDVGMAGQLITAYALSYAIATPIAAALTSGLARERVLLAGLVVFALGNVATAFAPDIYSALLGRAISGLGAAIFAPAASATAVALTDPGRRGHALAYMMVGLSSATALGAPMGTALSEFFDWRTIIALIACLGAVVALGVSVSIRNVGLPKPIAMRDRISPLGDAHVAGALLATFLVLAGLYTVYSYISVVFLPVTKGDGSILAMLLSVWGLGAIAGSLAAGRLTDTYGSRAIVNMTLVCLAVDIAVLYWTSAFLATSHHLGFDLGRVRLGIHNSAAASADLDPAGLFADHSRILCDGGLSRRRGLGCDRRLVLQVSDARSLPLAGAALVVAGLLVSEMTYFRKEKSARP